MYLLYKGLYQNVKLTGVPTKKIIRDKPNVPPALSALVTNKLKAAHMLIKYTEADTTKKDHE
jgi:hypothetical protein